MAPPIAVSANAPAKGEKPSGTGFCRAREVELVGINSLTRQGGCFGETETRTGAVNPRVDDVNSWIQQIRAVTKAGHVMENSVTTADSNGDSRTDVTAIHQDGTLHAYFTQGRPDRPFGPGQPLGG
ncbi:hypothetical protein ACIQU6_22150 [Streptomyces sp. NPDC090442]|uniref:hypothetical protein n=1 Tax=Streptomyces sp. NPDC090442 TaxID=3365962 RepID=UPI0037FB92A9